MLVEKLFLGKSEFPHTLSRYAGSYENVENVSQAALNPSPRHCLALLSMDCVTIRRTKRSLYKSRNVCLRRSPKPKQNTKLEAVIIGELFVVAEVLDEVEVIDDIYIYIYIL